MPKNEHLLRKLCSLGLTEKQAQIYLSIHKHGVSSVLDIFRDTHIQRPTIYENVVTLESLGLVETIVKGAKKRLTATASDRLRDLIKQKEIVANALIEDLAAIKQGEAPRNPVRLYAGREGAKKLADHILESKGGRVFTLGNHELLYTIFAERDLHRLWEARVAKNIVIDALFPAADLPELQKNKDYSETGNARYNRRVRILPDSVHWDVMYTIVDDHVLFWSSQEEDFFFQFSSPSYASSLRTVFQTLWQLSKPLEALKTNQIV